MAAGTINQAATFQPGWPGRVIAAVAKLRLSSAGASRAGVLPWVPFWMSLGIGGWFLLGHEPGATFYLVAAILSLAGMGLWRWLPLIAGGRLGWSTIDHLRLAGLAVGFITLGALAIGLRAHQVAAPVLGFRYYGAVEGRVVEIDRSSRDRLRLTLDRVVLDDVAANRTPKRVRISLNGADQRLPVPGERVMLSAHLGPPGGPAEPGGFDFRRLAWFDAMGAIGYSRTPILTVEPARPGGALALHRLRMRMSKAIRDSIGGQAGAVSAALMTGDRSAITEATNEVMRASNLYHIVSISGLHMSMLSGFVYAALRFAGMLVQRARHRSGARVHKMAALGALIAAAGYLWLSGGDVATERSFVMVAVMLLAIVADRRAISLRTVAVAATVILISAPEAVLSPGFQMSFAATVALILASEPWRGIAPHVPRWARPVVMLLITSLVAGLVTSPIAAAHFGRVSQYGMLANLLVVPVAGLVVMPAGAIAALLAPFGLQDLPLWFMGLGTKWMLLVAEWIAGLHGTTTTIASPPRAVLPLMAVGACLAILAPVGARHGIAGRTVLRRVIGVSMISAATLLWSLHARPEILISAEGDAVGVMTASGRVPSKPKGGGFAVTEWLQSDGDRRSQIDAAASGPWQGEMNARRLDLAVGARTIPLYHLTGKRAAELAAGLCKGGAIIIANVRLEEPAGAGRDCRILDQQTLRATGAVSLSSRQGSVTLVATSDRAGERLWTGGRKGR